MERKLDQHKDVPTCKLAAAQLVNQERLCSLLRRRELSRKGRPAKRERLWGATVKADFIQHRSFVSRQGGQLNTQRLLLTLAAMCLAAIVTTGCQFDHGHQAAVEPHYGQLEQTCFGYEPTVWRTMSGDCEQAVRVIPDEVVQLPVAAPIPAESDNTPPTEPPTGPLPLEQVPEPGQESPRVPGLFRDLEPAEQPPAETNPPPTESAPADDAEVPAPTQPVIPPAESAPTQPVEPEPAPAEQSAPPTTDEPQSDTPAAEPAEAPAPPESKPPVSMRPVSMRPVSMPPVRTPVTPVTQRRTLRPTNVAASELFRSVEQALGETTNTSKPARTRVAEKKGTIGLARFISY